MKQEKRVVPHELGVCRIDRAVRQLYQVSWGKARSWIESGKITLEGNTVLSPETEGQPGQEIIYTENAPDPKGLHPKQIVWMDRHLIVAEKPSGLLTVPFDEDDRDCFCRQIRIYLSHSGPQIKKKRSALPPLLVVQRLDKDTSGLMVFARTSAGQDGLQEQFREHTVVRRYAAIVHGEMGSTTIRSHLFKNRGNGRRESVECSPNAPRESEEEGKLAVTHVQLERRYRGATFVSCRLETGRTNQIRIHLCEHGHPVLGDAIYRRNYVVIQAPRLMLHAAELGFIHPVSGEKLHFESALPKEFTELLSGLTPL